MEKNMENDMETGVIMGNIGFYILSSPDRDLALYGANMQLREDSFSWRRRALPSGGTNSRQTSMDPRT